MIALIQTIAVILAAACNAAMDLIENENYSRSIFSRYNEKFWYKRESWKHAYKFGEYKLDAWHLLKSTMLCLIATTIALNSVPSIFMFIWFGVVWNVSFNLFYNYIWIKQH